MIIGSPLSIAGEVSWSATEIQYGNPQAWLSRIVVDGIAYRWKVPQVDNNQEDGWPGVAAAVQQVEPTGSQLWLAFPNRFSFSGPLANEGKPILPSDIAAGIRAALASGWKADRPGRQFVFHIVDEGVEG